MYFKRHSRMHTATLEMLLQLLSLEIVLIDNIIELNNLRLGFFNPIDGVEDFLY